MNTSRFSISAIAALAVLTLGTVNARAHDEDRHHSDDHARADAASDHARYDTDHASAARYRALQTGDPRDFYHALRDSSHASQSRHDAHHAQDHASDHGYGGHYHD